MQRVLTVMIVEDEQELCEEFEKCFAESDGLELAAATGNADQGLELIQYLHPDVLILDLELHNGGGNGIVLLNELSKLVKAKKLKKPFILVNTNNSSRTTYQIVRNLGADFVMYKHQEGSGPEDIAEFLYAVRAGGSEMIQPEMTDPITKEEKVPLRARILEELNNIAICPRSKGYNYLADAIEIYCGGQTPNVSSVIGVKYGKTEASVERAMQNAIDRAWSTADINDLYEHYTAHINSKRCSPTVTEFICYYAAKINSGK